MYTTNHQFTNTFPLLLQRYSTSNIFPILPSVFLNQIPASRSLTVQTVVTVSLRNGNSGEDCSFELTPSDDHLAVSELLTKRERCEKVSLLQFSLGSSNFHTVICTVPQGLKNGDPIELESSWRAVCRTSKTTNANVQNNKVIRPIRFGEEIILEEKPKVELSIETSTTPIDLKNIPESRSSYAFKNGGYQCDRCGKVFTYEYYKEKHLKYTRCVDQGNRKFRCLLCPRSFEKRDRLRIHVLHVHENYRPHVCTVCGKSFSQSSSLNKHLRVHSGERPYRCEHCGKRFTASSILRTHIRQHSGEKPFQCSVCGKSFASHAAHDSHVRRTHSLQETHRFKCGVCDKTFEHKSHLNFHEQFVHSSNL